VGEAKRRAEADANLWHVHVTVEIAEASTNLSAVGADIDAQVRASGPEEALDALLIIVPKTWRVIGVSAEPWVPWEESQ